MTTRLSFDELHARARERALTEQVPVRYLGDNRYAVPSRKTYPGQYRTVVQLPTGALVCTTENPEMEHCWPFRTLGTCTHVAAVQLVLERRVTFEMAVAAPEIETEWADEVPDPLTCRTCHRTLNKLFDGQCATCWFED